MTSRTVVVFGVYLLLALSVALPSAPHNVQTTRDTGIHAEFKYDCLDPAEWVPQIRGYIKKICGGFFLDSCSRSLSVNLTYGDTIILDETINDAAKQERCSEPQGSGSATCRTCLGFEQLVITPSYAKIQPALRERCSICLDSGHHHCIELNENAPPEFTQVFELGDRCDGKGCSDCTNSGNCGWCDFTQKCSAKGRNGPYCGECKANWLTVQPSCPDYQQWKAAHSHSDKDGNPSQSDGSGPSGAEVAAIILGVLLCLGLIAAAVWFIRARSIQNKNAPSRAEMDSYADKGREPILSGQDSSSGECGYLPITPEQAAADDQDMARTGAVAVSQAEDNA